MTHNVADRANADDRQPFFVTDVSKATLLETWRVLGPAPGRLTQFIAILVARLAGKPLRFGIPVSRADTEFIALCEIPDEIKRQQDAVLQPLVQAGFVPLFGLKNQRLKSLRGYSAYLRSSDHTIVAGAAFAQARDEARVILQLDSKLSDNTIITTNNSAPLMRLPAQIKAVNLANASPTTVLARHKRRIQQFTHLVIFSDEDARNLVRDMARQICEFRTNCGLYVPATDEELRHAGIIE
jgi:hypothetical protein